MNSPFKLSDVEDTLSFEEKKGMGRLIKKLCQNAAKEPFVFQCPDGSLLKIEVYDPKPIDPFSSEHAQEMMSDKFVIAAINQAFENGIKSARNRI